MCGVRHWVNASPVASCFVIDKKTILLIQRGTEPYKGYWDCPSGFCEAGEHPIETAVRETKEETGLDVRVRAFLGIWRSTYDIAEDPEPAKHTLNICYVADPVGGRLAPSPEAPELRWFELDQIPVDMFYPDKHDALKALTAALRTGQVPVLPDRPSVANTQKPG